MLNYFAWIKWSYPSACWLFKTFLFPASVYLRTSHFFSIADANCILSYQSYHCLPACMKYSLRKLCLTVFIRYCHRDVGRIFWKGGWRKARNAMKCRRHYGQRSGGFQRPMTTCSWNDWFSFLSLLIPLFTFFSHSVFLSPLSLFFSGGAAAPSALLPTPVDVLNDITPVWKRHHFLHSQKIQDGDQQPSWIGICTIVYLLLLIK